MFSHHKTICKSKTLQGTAKNHNSAANLQASRQAGE